MFMPLKVTNRNTPGFRRSTCPLRTTENPTSLNFSNEDQKETSRRSHGEVPILLKAAADRQVNKEVGFYLEKRSYLEPFALLSCLKGAGSFQALSSEKEGT